MSERDSGPASGAGGSSDQAQASANVGVVVRLARRHIVVRIAPEESGDRLLRCSPGGRLFGAGDRDRAGRLVVGDEVEIERVDDGGRIVAVRPRRNELRRAVGPPERRQLRVLAANLDRFFIVSAFREPPYRTGFVDRSLVVAHDAEVKPALVFNKLDLAEAEDLKRLDENLREYRALDLEVYRTSTLTGDGIEALRTAAGRGRSVLFGHSGVGKTMLLAALGVPGRRSGAVDRRGRGRHTTTSSEAIRLPGGGEIVDTPGVRALGIDGLTPERVRAAYPDLSRFASDCRFAGCAHDTEPGCGVKAAVASGDADASRRESLLRLAAEAGGLTTGFADLDEA